MDGKLQEGSKMRDIIYKSFTEKEIEDKVLSILREFESGGNYVLSKDRHNLRILFCEGLLKERIQLLRDEGFLASHMDKILDIYDRVVRLSALCVYIEGELLYTYQMSRYSLKEHLFKTIRDYEIINSLQDLRQFIVDNPLLFRRI